MNQGADIVDIWHKVRQSIGKPAFRGSFVYFIYVDNFKYGACAKLRV